MNSSKDSTISTSLIHNNASDGKSEQVVTWLLNLIFQYQRIIDLFLQAVYKGTGKGKWGFGKGHNWNEKGGKGGKDAGKNPRKQRAGERWQGRNQNVLDVRQDRTHCSLVQEKEKQNIFTHLTKNNSLSVALHIHLSSLSLIVTTRMLAWVFPRKCPATVIRL